MTRSLSASWRDHIAPGTKLDATETGECCEGFATGASLPPFWLITIVISGRDRDAQRNAWIDDPDTPYERWYTLHTVVRVTNDASLAFHSGQRSRVRAAPQVQPVSWVLDGRREHVAIWYGVLSPGRRSPFSTLGVYVHHVMERLRGRCDTVVGARVMRQCIIALWALPNVYLAATITRHRQSQRRRWQHESQRSHVVDSRYIKFDWQRRRGVQRASSGSADSAVPCQPPLVHRRGRVSCLRVLSPRAARQTARVGRDRRRRSGRMCHTAPRRSSLHGAAPVSPRRVRAAPASWAR